MPFVLERDDSLLTIEFGQFGDSITFQMREDGGSIQQLRLLTQKQKRATLAADRLERLSEQAKDAKSNSEYQQINDQIKLLGNEPDAISVLVDMILAGAKGWTDFYADKTAEAKGEVLDFTKENIERLPVKALNKIGLAFVAHYGLTGDEVSGEAKGSLPEQSQPMKLEAGSSPIGTENSAATAQ